MFRRNMLIQVDNNGLQKKQFYFAGSYRRKVTELNNKNLYILIYDEEVYIKKLILPKIKGEKVYNIVKNELIFSVGNISNILFDYKVVKKNKKNIEVLVYYINCKKISFINSDYKNTNIKKINLIQFVMYNYYKKFTEEKNYIFMFVHDNYLYILIIRGCNIISNMIVNENIETFLDLNYIISKLKINYSEQLNGIENIYIVYDYNKINEYFEPEGFNVKILKKYKNEKVISSFINGGIIK